MPKVSHLVWSGRLSLGLTANANQDLSGPDEPWMNSLIDSLIDDYSVIRFEWLNVAAINLVRSVFVLIWSAGPPLGRISLINPTGDVLQPYDCSHRPTPDGAVVHFRQISLCKLRSKRNTSVWSSGFFLFTFSWEMSQKYARGRGRVYRIYQEVVNL